ncbi:MAG: hypothetical protein MJZ30_10025 [Paludibacteraceae bacterium]|nr:hypothetical protein [Paludibacteraceae bacterium]
MAQKYKVTTETTPLRLRREPNEKDDSNIIARIPKDAIVEEAGSGVITPVAGWKYISYNGQFGWASSLYLTPIDENGNKTAEPDKSNPVKDEDTSGNGDKKEPNGKAWMIAGAVTMAIGAVLNLVL